MARYYKVKFIEERVFIARAKNPKEATQKAHDHYNDGTCSVGGAWRQIVKKTTKRIP